MSQEQVQEQGREGLVNLPWEIPAYRIRIRGVDSSTPKQVKAAIKSGARLEEIGEISALVLEDNKKILLIDDELRLKNKAYEEFYQTRGKPITKSYFACLPPL